MSDDKLNIEQIDSAPTIVLPEQTKVRFSEIAKELEAARVQGYVEASFANKLLDLAQQVVGMIGKA